MNVCMYEYAKIMFKLFELSFEVEGSRTYYENGSL